MRAAAEGAFYRVVAQGGVEVVRGVLGLGFVRVVDLEAPLCSRASTSRGERRWPRIRAFAAPLTAMSRAGCSAARRMASATRLGPWIGGGATGLTPSFVRCPWPRRRPWRPARRTGGPSPGLCHSKPPSRPPPVPATALDPFSSRRECLPIGARGALNRRFPILQEPAERLHETIRPLHVGQVAAVGDDLERALRQARERGSP
jgi:hypothetical protein